LTGTKSNNKISNIAVLSHIHYRYGTLLEI
jgi:hypothetical protein